MANTAEVGANALEPNWKGPYKIKGLLIPGSYKLEELNEKEISCPWNVEHLQTYYQELS